MKTRKEAKIESEIIKMLEKDKNYVRALEGKRTSDAGVSDLMYVTPDGTVKFLETKTPEEFDLWNAGLSDAQLRFLFLVKGRVVTLKSGVMCYKDPSDIVTLRLQKLGVSHE